MSRRAPDSFMEYFRRNYPGPHTVISVPDWHAPKIYAAAIAASGHRELLEACKMMLAFFESLDRNAAPDDPLTRLRNEYHRERIEALKAAIAKAEAQS